MIEESVEDGEDIPEGLMNICFSRVLTFIIFHVDKDSTKCRKHSRIHCPECDPKRTH